MSVSLDSRTALAGFLSEKLTQNQDCEFVIFSTDDISKYVRGLWNAGCGPVLEDYSEKELCYYLNCVSFCSKSLYNTYVVKMNYFKPNKELELELELVSPINIKRFLIFYYTGARINYPYLLLNYMGFGCFFE